MSKLGNVSPTNHASLMIHEKSSTVVSSSESRMQFCRFALILFIIWSFSLCAILLLLLRVEYLRSFLMEDFTVNQNYDILEKKAKLLFSIQSKRKNSSGVPTTTTSFVNSTLWANITRLLDLYTNSVNDTSSDFILSKHVTGGEKCIPQQNVAFLKSHKTGSSTVTNVLNRYADLHELTVALPAMGMVRFDWPRPFHWTSVDLLRLDGNPANILCNHARFKKEQLQLIMATGTKYITILRDPATQFESAFYYFGMAKELGLDTETDPIGTFLEDPDDLLLNVTERRGDLPQILNLAQSGMSYDLGYDFLDLEDDAEIQAAIRKLHDQFSLVMLMEYFDESLVLLTYELCWELDDVLYIKQNERSIKRDINETVAAKIRNWNRADSAIYAFFNRTLWEKINSHGNLFWKDLSRFRRKNSEFRHKCSPQRVNTKGYKSNEDITLFKMSPTAPKFDRYFCTKSLKSEVEYLRYFRQKFSSTRRGYQKILLDEGLRNERSGQGELHRRLKMKKVGNGLASKGRPIMIPKM